MMPIVFWASLLPCDSAMNPAEATWSWRNVRREPVRVPVPADPEQDHEHEADREPDERAKDQAFDHPDEAADLDRPPAGVCRGRTDQPAHQGVR